MDDISRYGKVRKATRGEIGTHLATGDIQKGDSLIVYATAGRKQSAELHFDIPMIFIGVDHATGRDKTVFREVSQREQEELVPSWLEKFTVVVVFAVLTVIVGSAIFFSTLIARSAKAETLPPQTITATVTAYTSSVDETDSTPNITASGKKTAPGTIACPAQFSFGTQVRIGDATYTCRDRMNARFSDRFDIWVHTKAEARVWGKQTLAVQIL